MEETAANLICEARAACLSDQVGRARELMLEVLDRSSRLDRSSLTLVLEQLAQIERIAGDHHVAHLHLLDAAGLAEAENDPAALVALLRQLGDIDRSIGSVERAERYFEEALILCQGRQQIAHAVQAELLRSMASLWWELGNQGEADFLRRRADELLPQPAAAIGSAHPASLDEPDPSAGGS